MSFPILNGRYTFHKTIGSGGFGKVKLATHDLTGEKVAIKIMDKELLADDLPRVQVEIMALKELQHHNICRLYEVIETDKKIFLVMEYCSGGELFDYIVARDRLPEQEARMLFRQIVAAIGYIHLKGFAHRDLKPENILLDSMQNVKLIDFGLCAKPRGGMHLKTCCGSPQYVAPELLSGQPYLGNQADIWSMGVLLYALLCGFLPFEDETLGVLYKKIQSGRYDCPPWLSQGSRRLLSQLLQVDPKKRIRIEQLAIHPWIMEGYAKPVILNFSPKIFLDDECICEMAMYHGMSRQSMEREITRWRYDQVTATYLLLVKRKQRGRPVRLLGPSLPLREHVSGNTPASVFATPKIPKALPPQRPRNQTPREHHNATKRPHQQQQHPSWHPAKQASSTPSATPSSSSAASSTPLTPRNPYQRSNNAAAAAVTTPTRKKAERKGVFSKGKENRSSNNTDQRQPHLNTSPSLATTPRPVEKRMDDDIKSSPPLSAEKRSWSVGADIPLISDTPGSAVKFSRPLAHSAQKVFSSLEKGLDRMRIMFTPGKRDAPTTPAESDGPPMAKALYNVASVASTDPDLVLEMLKDALTARGIPCIQKKKYTLRGKVRDPFGKVALTFDLEVCRLPRNLVGIRRKRLEGDAWHYKRICEEILKLATDTT